MYKIINFPTLSSTNKYLKENYSLYDEYTVINTNKQTHGKGRMQRTWISNTEDDLTFSILLKPNFDSTKIAQISLIAGASVCKVINKYIQCSIKWPNDIIVNDKKIAGILVEAVTTDKVEAVVVGIGLNVNSTMFDSNLIMKASSLKLEMKTENKLDKERILTEIIDGFIDIYQLFLKKNDYYLQIIKHNNYLKNKEVYVNNEQVKVLDINAKGNLVIEKNNTIQELFFGEVTLEKIYKEVK